MVRGLQWWRASRGALFVAFAEHEEGSELRMAMHQEPRVERSVVVVDAERRGTAAGANAGVVANVLNELGYAEPFCSGPGGGESGSRKRCVDAGIITMVLCESLFDFRR